MGIRVSLTGRVSIETDGASVDEQRFPGRQGRLVFAYLLVAHGRPVPRDELAEALWNGEPPATWEKALTVLISKLRVVLEECGVDGTAITSAFGCYKLTLPRDAWVDLVAAEGAVERAERALAAGDPDEARASATTAAELARRTFLPGEDGLWVEEQRRRLQRLVLRALECHADASLRSGHANESLRSAEQIVEREPFRESGYRRLMQAHIAAGNSAEALTVYERCRTLIADELGAYPSAEIERLYLDILRAPAAARAPSHQPAQAGPPLVASAREVSSARQAPRSPRLRRTLLLAFTCAAAAAAAAVFVSTRGDDPEPQSGSFAGAWVAIDRDGSNQTMDVTHRAGTDAYDIRLEDDDATACGGGYVSGSAVGTAVGNRLAATLELACASGAKLEYPHPLTYRIADDTLVDPVGVIWTRSEDAGTR